MAKSFKHYLGAPKRRIELYFGSAEKLGYKGFSKFKVAFDIWWWRRIHHYKPNDYVFYGFDKYSPSYRKLFLRDYDQYITYAKLNVGYGGGKGGQYERYGKEIIGRDWLRVDKTPLETVKEFINNNKNVIFKPNTGSCGRGVFAFDISDGSKAMEETLLSIIGSNYICEQFIEQHEKMTILHPQSVNSVRVLVLNDHGTPHIIAATLKLGGDEKVVDNLRNGGLAANINVENGIVDTPAFDLEDNCTYFTKTGASIIGFELPNWDKVCELAKKVILCSGTNILLGLDIAITNEEAVLIETNNRPGTRIVQSFDKKPKGMLIREYCKTYKKELRKIPRCVKKKHKNVF
ncbi:MAG: ATP-grasp domain-containing protein [Ruminococcaceae bacterium]|nr:ATP-grasp domain-containing protein [Oscillospiraceae bacterium]